MRIDCQSHVFPREYAEILARNPYSIRAIPQDGEYMIKYGDVQNFQLKLESYDIDRKLRDMDSAGVDISVLTVNMPGPDVLAPELRLDGAKACNNYVAEVVARHKDRFVGLACLPWRDVPSSIAEMERAKHDLGLKGIVLYSRIGETQVDDPVYERIYQCAEELRLPIVLHPVVPTWAEAIKDYSMIPMVGLMVDHSFAMLRLILSGILERHPSLNFIQPHAGGVLPYLWGRVRNQTEVMQRGIEKISQSPDVYYKRVYLDMVSPSELAMRFAYNFAGADRLLFGSDHPWVDIDIFADMIENLDIPQEDKDKIFGLNAQRIFCR